MKRTNGSTSSPGQERELAAIDVALAGEQVEPELAELAHLALALRDERPRPRADYARDLDATAATGFAAAGSRSPRASRRFASEAPGMTSVATPRPGPLERLRAGRRALPLAFAGAASVFIAVTAVLSSGVLSPDSGKETDVARRELPSVVTEKAERQDSRRAPSAAPGASAAPQATGRDRGSSAGGGADDALIAPAPPRPAGGAPNVRPRKQERSASLTLAAPRDEVEDVADEAIGITDRYRGFVVRSTVSGGEQGRAGATLELRIPSDLLQPALRDLSELAHVRSRTQSTQDITGRFVSVRGRLRDALAERRSLLEQLARADTDIQTATIRARLRLVRRQIDDSRSALGALRQRVGFSTVAVDVEADDRLSSEGGGWSPADALDDALTILGVAVAVALVTLAVAAPLGLLALGGWLVFRAGLRRRRERALDEPASGATD